jgi:hypothetical protein
MPLPHLKISRGVDSCPRFRRMRGIRRRILIVAMGVAWMPLAHAARQGPAQGEAAEVAVLMARVGAPSPAAVDEFKKAGMEEVRPHVLTAPERAKVESVLASLPELNRRVLEKKLHTLAFVDGVPGEGTGLTSRDGTTGLYDITLRASILDEPLSTFLTNKEQRVFREDGSGITVTVTGTGTDAVTYVLLHESTHVVDFACGITAQPQRGFGAGIWASQKEMVLELADSIAAKTYFRGGSRVPMGQAAAVYDALAQTPFVSVYATAEPQEDLAELVAWREIQKEHHGGLVITVKDAQGKTLGRWEPLSFPAVARRFAEVDRLLAQQGPCSGLSS